MASSPYTQFENGNVPPTAMQKAQQDCDQVVGYMKDNIVKIMDREEQLGDLEDKTEQLQYAASSFKEVAKQIETKFWYQNCKWKVMMILLLVAGLGVGVLFAAVPDLLGGGDGDPVTTPSP